MILNIDGLDINYISEGEGENVIVLHGWGANIDTVMPIINILKEKYRVYAIDLPGFGKSQQPLDVMSSFEYVEIIRGFMDKLNIKRTTFVGHSFGGKLSIIMGANYPSQVEKIVLIDSAGLIPKRGLNYYFKVYSFKADDLIMNRNDSSNVLIIIPTTTGREQFAVPIIKDSLRRIAVSCIYKNDTESELDFVK